MKAARGLEGRRASSVAAYAMSLVVASLLANHPFVSIVVIAASLGSIAGAGRLREARPYLWTALYTGIGLAVINALFSGGGLHQLAQASFGSFRVRITLEGLAFGAGQALQLVSVISAFAAAILVVHQDYQLAALSRLSARSALVVSLATRLLPVLSRDASRIADAQRSRGAELDRGPWRTRALARGPLLSGLLSQSLERAVDIAASMESRGYGRAGRSIWQSRQKQWRTEDVVIAACACLSVAMFVAAAIRSDLQYTYFPKLANPATVASSPLVLLACICLLLPVFWSLKWRALSR